MFNVRRQETKQMHICTFEYSNGIYGALKANSIWSDVDSFLGVFIDLHFNKTNGIIKIKENTQT